MIIYSGLYTGDMERGDTSMNYKVLGKTGLKVSEIGFGRIIVWGLKSWKKRNKRNVESNYRCM